MTKEELEKEAEKWLRKFLLCNDCKRKCHCIELNAYCEEQVLKAYIDSAEPREKRIKELEKENTELKSDNDARKFAMAMSEKVEKQLREENAELKGIKDVATLIRANNDTVITLMQLNNMLVSKNQQLTKAKEIIKELLNLPFASDEEVFADVSTLLGKAEQFLKDNEVEK